MVLKNDISIPGSGVVKGVDEEEGHGAGHTSGGDVHAELVARAGVFGHGKGSLDCVLESEVEGLGGEVPEHIGQVSCNCKEN